MSTQVGPVSGENVLAASIFTNTQEIARAGGETALQNALVGEGTLAPPTGFVSNLINKLSTNKKYLYMGIAVVVLAGAVYYYYYKHKKGMVSCPPSAPKTNQDIPTTKPDNILDTNGKPHVVNTSKEDEQILLLKKQLQIQQQALQHQQQQQALQQQAQQQHYLAQQQQQEHNTPVQKVVLPNKHVLQHPNDDSSDCNDDSDDSDEINAKVASIQAKESGNVSKQNLTNSEIEEINKKLEQMKR
jgi:hypothetical protein